MKRLALVILLLVFSNALFSQATWSEDIAALVYTNCSHCHHDGGIAPFELMSYNDVVDWSHLMEHAIEENEMPPWPADPNYRHFANEDYLTDAEKELFLTWIAVEMPEGNLATAPIAPTFPPSGSLLDTVDMVIAIEPYTLQTNLDEYRWFVVPNPSSETIYVNKIEVMAGLEDIVHHADISFDLTGNSLQNDLADPLPGFNGSTGGPTYSFYMNAWQPGGNIMRYPEGWGIAVPPDGDFVIEIHYGPGGVLQTDSTYMNLQFVTNIDEVRPVQSNWFLNESPQVFIDGPLFIPANEVVTFHQQSAPLANAMSLISICPHMHFLGKSYKVWAVTPGNETIPLIDIPNWDFHWQKYYVYPTIEYIPQGSIIYSEGVYDNTVNNHDNPNNPPINVSSGLKTTDEMFLCFFTYANYQLGDDTINMEQLFELEIPEPEPVGLEHVILGDDLNVYPNPIKDVAFIKGNLKRANLLNIMNLEGKVVFEKTNITSTIDLSQLSNGIYFAQLIGENDIQVQRIVKQ